MHRDDDEGFDLRVEPPLHAPKVLRRSHDAGGAVQADVGGQSAVEQMDVRSAFFLRSSVDVRLPRRRIGKLARSEFALIEQAAFAATDRQRRIPQLRERVVGKRCRPRAAAGEGEDHEQLIGIPSVRRRLEAIPRLRILRFERRVHEMMRAPGHQAREEQRGHMMVSGVPTVVPATFRLRDPGV